MLFFVIDYFLGEGYSYRVRLGVVVCYSGFGFFGYGDCVGFVLV